MKSFDPVAYARWRESIPWSNEAIAHALEEEAQVFRDHGNEYMAGKFDRRAVQVRGGRLSKFDVKQTLARLVTTCAICGRTALYRYGVEGRCRAHKDAASIGFKIRRAHLEEKSAGFEEDTNRFEFHRNLRDRFHAKQKRLGGAQGGRA